MTDSRKRKLDLLENSDNESDSPLELAGDYVETAEEEIGKHKQEEESLVETVQEQREEDGRGRVESRFPVRGASSDQDKEELEAPLTPISKFVHEAGIESPRNQARSISAIKDDLLDAELLLQLRPEDWGSDQLGLLPIGVKMDLRLHADLLRGASNSAAASQGAVSPEEEMEENKQEEESIVVSAQEHPGSAQDAEELEAPLAPVSKFVRDSGIKSPILQASVISAFKDEDFETEEELLDLLPEDWRRGQIGLLKKGLRIRLERHADLSRGATNSAAASQGVASPEEEIEENKQEEGSLVVSAQEHSSSDQDKEELEAPLTPISKFVRGAGIKSPERQARSISAIQTEGLDTTLLQHLRPEHWRSGQLGLLPIAVMRKLERHADLLRGASNSVAASQGVASPEEEMEENKQEEESLVVTAPEHSNSAQDEEELEAPLTPISKFVRDSGIESPRDQASAISAIKGEQLDTKKLLRLKPEDWRMGQLGLLPIGVGRKLEIHADSLRGASNLAAASVQCNLSALP